MLRLWWVNQFFLVKLIIKLSEAYVGKDDFVEIKPNYETEFIYVRTDWDIDEGIFWIFIDEELYSKEIGGDYYPSWYYSYMTDGPG